MERIWSKGRVTPAARRGIARRVLTLWVESGHYLGADDYLNSIATLIDDAKTEGRVFDVGDLPPIPPPG